MHNILYAIAALDYFNLGEYDFSALNERVTYSIAVTALDDFIKESDFSY